MTTAVPLPPSREADPPGHPATEVGHAEQRLLEGRAAASHAAHLLPYLRPGMRLLDCGCGPGAITVGLAEAVAPGEVIGVDLDEALLARARHLATERGLTNVRFQRADVARLPFADDAVDAVFARDLLTHLAAPAPALAEMRRVLRRGGVVAVADPDPDAELFAPSNPRLAALRDLWRRYLDRHGRPAMRARDHRRLLLDAGFVRVEARAVVAESAGAREATRLVARLLAERLEEPAFVEVIVEHGWTDVERLEAMYEAALAWGERPDAVAASLAVAAVGWKP